MFNTAMRFDLGEEIDSLREMVHRWAQERVKPLAVEVDRSNLFPAALWREMGDLGMTVPEAYGGTGLGYLAHAVAIEAIVRA